MNLKSLLCKLSLLLTIGLFQQALQAWPNWQSIPCYLKKTLDLVRDTLYDVYHWRIPDTTLPTLDQLDVISFIPVIQSKESRNTPTKEALYLLEQKNEQGTLGIDGKRYTIRKGIPENFADIREPVSLYAGGYCHYGRPNSYSGYLAIKSGLVPGVCITFDFPTNTRRAFNFCQEQDIHCIKTVYDEVITKSPNASVILHEACKGAMNNLRFLAELSEDNGNYLNNIKAVIAESPPISVKKALQDQPGSLLTIPLMNALFPNYSPHATTIMHAKSFPPIPILLASLPKDTISKFGDMRAMKEHLEMLTRQKNIQWFISQKDGIHHGNIGLDENYQWAADGFLKKYNLRPNHQRPPLADPVWWAWWRTNRWRRKQEEL